MLSGRSGSEVCYRRKDEPFITLKKTAPDVLRARSANAWSLRLKADLEGGEFILALAAILIERGLHNSHWERRCSTQRGTGHTDIAED
jgi:hypothetical protein